MPFASCIDHTMLRPETTSADIKNLCSEALDARFAAVCVPPVFVREAAQLMSGSGVKIATVVGFPFGYHLTAVKAAEAELAILGGADELDMVINLSALKSGDWRTLETEIREILEIVKLSGKGLKVIIESGILSPAELEQCCSFYGRFHIDFLKTSTGYAAAGATLEAVQAMRRLLPGHVAIKASGGIRSYEFARQLLGAGATRIGTSASVQILAEAKSAGEA